MQWSDPLGRRFRGRTIFSRVTSLHIGDEQFSDADLAALPLKDLASLNAIVLTYTSVSEASIEQLSQQFPLLEIGIVVEEEELLDDSEQQAQPLYGLSGR